VRRSLLGSGHHAKIIRGMTVKPTHKKRTREPDGRTVEVYKALLGALCAGLGALGFALRRRFKS
jgi:hypothetical protein